MKNWIQLSVLLVCCFLAVNASAQRAPKCLKVATTARPTWVLVETAQLDKFCQQFGSGTSFEKMKIVKAELAYYLLASEKSTGKIYAFELEQKGKRLYVNRLYPIQACSEGGLTLDAFLQKDGKIQGCRMGEHEKVAN